MVTSVQAAGLEPVRPQTTQLQQRNDADATGARGGAVATDGLRVSISAEARAAETSARAATASSQSAPLRTQALDEAAAADPVQAAADVRRPDVAESAAAAPVATAQTELANRATTATTPTESALRGAAAPDGASTQGRTATQLYLENAIRPANQPGPPSGLRTSA